MTKNKDTEPMASPIVDPRFSKQQSDPRFQWVPKHLRKVKVDDRFKAMFDNKSSFGRKSVTDKYGRPVKHDIKEDLSRFYDLEDGENGEENTSQKEASAAHDEDSPDDQEKELVKKKKSNRGLKAVTKSEARPSKVGAETIAGKQKKKAVARKAEDEDEDEDEVENYEEDNKRSYNRDEASKKQNGKGGNHGLDKSLRQKAAKMQIADPVSRKLKDQDLRTAMMNWSSSSSEGSDDDDSDNEEKFLASALDISKPIVPITEYVATGEETRRLAIVGVDWERVKAMDLLVLLRSFAPSTGQIYNVKIYVSAFGKERLERERRLGPGAFIASKGKGHGSEDDDESGGGSSSGGDDATEFDPVRLRRYEADKLKYYYAIAECDSSRTAAAVYEQCDGMEYEASASVLDLRYVPDEETFDDSPHAVAAGEAPADYVSPFFSNSALGHTKVELSWDRDDPDRDVLKGKGLSGGKGRRKKRAKESEAIDYTSFLATESEGEEEEEDGVGGWSEGEDDRGGGRSGGGGGGGGGEAEDEKARRERARALLLGDASNANPFGSKGPGRKPAGAAGRGGGDGDSEAAGEAPQEEMVVTFTPGLQSAGAELVKKKKEREAEADMSVWDKYLKKRSEKKREARQQARDRFAAGCGGVGAAPGGAAAAVGGGKGGGKGDVPDEDALYVEDSFFDDDPFFTLPDDDADGAGGGGGKKEEGMWKKGKAGKGGGGDSSTAAAGAAAERRAAEEAKEKEKERLRLLMDSDGPGGGQSSKRGYSIKPTALGRATEKAGEAVDGGRKKEKRMKKKGRRGKGDDEDDEAPPDGFKLDTADARFASIYSDPRFALDPTDPNFRKTPGLSKLLEAGRDKRKHTAPAAAAAAAHAGGGDGGPAGKKAKKDPALAALVSTLKARGAPPAAAAY